MLIQGLQVIEGQELFLPHLLYLFPVLDLRLASVLSDLLQLPPPDRSPTYQFQDDKFDLLIVRHLFVLEDAFDLISQSRNTFICKLSEYPNRSILMVSYQQISYSNESPQHSHQRMRVPLWKRFSKFETSPSHLRFSGSTSNLASQFSNCVRRSVNSIICLFKSSHYQQIPLLLHDFFKSYRRLSCRFVPLTATSTIHHFDCSEKLHSRIGWALIPTEAI